MSIVVDALSWVLILGGGLAVLTTALGFIRLPDFFSRTHAVGVLDTLGAGLVLGGLGLQSGFSLVTAKLALILVFILITGATAMHALARAAEQTGVRPQTGERERTRSTR